ATTTTSKGSYSVVVNSGTYQVTLSSIGYQSKSLTIEVYDNSVFDFELSPKPISLGEIVVSSLRVNRKIKELPTPMAVVGKADYLNQSSITLSNVLANQPGVTMASDGAWATSINIRGLSENRLVSLVDGNRIETATDLTASLSMIDVNDIERVEIIKGAQSSLYGTGAMGGIVNIITKDGSFSNDQQISGGLISSFASVNNLINGSANLTASNKRWYVRLSGAYNHANDIRTPEGILPNSQFKSSNISAKIGVKPASNHLFKLQLQRYWATDVGIPGGDAFPGPATATYTDIGRQLFSASYQIIDVSEKLSSLEFSYYNQYILRDVALEPNVVTETPIATGIQRTIPELFTPTGEHNTNGFQLQSEWNFSQTNTLVAGADVWSRKLHTEREKYIRVELYDTEGILTTTNNIVRGETPNPGSTFTSAGIFVQDEHRFLNDRLKLVLGGRIDGIRVKNDEGYDIDYLIVNGNLNDSPPNQRITFEEGLEYNFSWSVNAGLLYELVKDFDLSVSAARSFRAPSLEERFKYIDLTNMVRLGDPTLKPESGYSANLGLRVWKPKFNLQVDGFANWIENMIVEVPGEFIYTINTGPSEGVVDTLPALVNANVSKAMLYGFDFGFEYNFYTNFVVLGSAAYVVGVDTDKDENLPLIPPFNGRLGLRYSNVKLGNAQFSAIGASQQNLVAEGELETEGYIRFDFALSSPNF
ncbi:MAG TPA: TonB-dependent receptor, partial [Tenuifilaceae bacterium]|nr:TonB-dependent receptor [Tenuifilaceae bacterium]